MTHQTPVVIAVVNYKGGVGKTTTSVNLAAALAGPRRDVLLVDLDSQASASRWLGVGPGELLPSAANCLLRGLPLHKAIRATAVKHLDLVTGSGDLANADLALADVAGRESVLKRVLQNARPQYAAVVLDCPPALSLVSINALVAADAVIVPVVPQHLAAAGLGGLVESVERVRGRLASRARLLGILLTRVASRRAPASAEIANRLRAEYRDLVFHTEIPDSTELQEAPAAGQTILDLRARSNAADAYRRLAGEVLERLRAVRG